MVDTFSTRFGIQQALTTIKERETAPSDLRKAVLVAARNAGSLTSYAFYSVVCKVMNVPIRGHYSSSSLDSETNRMMLEADWPDVYDIIEALAQEIGVKHPDQFGFQYAVNKTFYSLGIGYLLNDGRIELRGEVTFEEPIIRALDALDEEGFVNAKNYLKAGISALSDRVNPRPRDAVKNAFDALEAVARDLFGGKTFGEAVTKLDKDSTFRKLLESIYGHANHTFRHGKEEVTPPTLEEAEFVVSISASAVTLLLNEYKRS